MDIGIGIELVVGAASFVMIEIMAIVFAYNAIETDTANQDMIKRVNHNMKLGKWFIVSIMVIFNIYYVLSSNGIALHDWIRIVIFLFIGTSAPVVAFLTGEIWAIDKIKHDVRLRKQNEIYNEAYQEWEIGLVNSWNSQKKKWGGQVNISVSEPVQSDGQMDGQRLMLSNRTDNGRTNGHGYDYVSNASDKVRAYFMENPEHKGWKVRDLAEVIGVGKSTVSSVRKEMQLNDSN
jgi:hypothetical protein